MKVGRFTKFVIYAGAALVAGLVASETVIGLEILGPRNEVDKTLLQQRIASSREIQKALSTPLPPPEPLPPITAHLANAKTAQTASSSSAKNPWSKTNSLPPEALDAMAKSLTTPPPDSSEYVSHSSGRSRTVDRAVGAGF
jgi:hypothetical protein